MEGYTPGLRVPSDNENERRYERLAIFSEYVSGGRYRAENIANRLRAAHVLDRNGQLRPNAHRIINSYIGQKYIGYAGWQNVAEGGSL